MPAGQPVRLYTKGVISGYKRGQRRQTTHTSLVHIEGVETKEAARFYLGKKVAFVYRARRATQNRITKEKTNIRCIWGKVTRSHGSTGTVRAKFTSNLPPKAHGASVRVFMYPSSV